MLNWSLALDAFALWIAATLLYLRPFIMRGIARRRAQREAAEKR